MPQIKPGACLLCMTGLTTAPMAVTLIRIKKGQSNKMLEKIDNLKHTKIIYGCAHRFIAHHIHPTADAMIISSSATAAGIMPIELANANIGAIHCHGRGW